MALQRRANGGLRKNAGDLTPALAKAIVAAVRKTPLSKRAAAYACGLIVQDLNYMIKRGSLPGADPLWEDTSRRVRELIADAEAKNYARLESAAEASVPAMVEIQRQIEKNSWGIDPTPEDAPLVYDAIFANPDDLPDDLKQALRANAATIVDWLGRSADRLDSDDRASRPPALEQSTPESSEPSACDADDSQPTP